MAINFIKLGDMPRPPECVLSETKEYKEEQDLVGRFLLECCEYTSAGKEQMKNIYAAFKWWCIREKGFTPKDVWSQNNLGINFKMRPELTKIESNKVFYSGIRIRPEWCVKMEDGTPRSMD